MNIYYVVGFILFAIVFFIWAAALDKPTVKKVNIERQKNIDKLEANRSARRESLNSRGRSSLDDDYLDPANMLNPLSPLYIYDDNDVEQQSQSSGSGGQGAPGYSSDVSSSGGGGYSGSSYSSDSGGSSYSSSDSGGCSGGSD